MKPRMLAVLLVAICAAIWLCSSSPGGNDSTRSTMWMVGDKAILHSDDGAPLLVGVDKEALEAAIDASVSGDDYAGTQLLLTGQLFLVDSGTRVLVIDLTLYYTKVRILEGPYAGTAVWVFEDKVRRE